MMCSHYNFLANRYPGTGGLYNYVKHIFGYDRAFLVAWFMFLVYISIFWANATSIPLFARYFLGGIFKVGYLYTIFGYEVYLGEALVTILAIGLVALMSIRSKRVTARALVMLVVVFTVGITACFLVAMAKHGKTGMVMAPAFLPDKSAFRQAFRIAYLSPWAFIGFESVDHSAMEYRFECGKLFRILVAATTVTTALYIFVILMSVSAYPEGCSSWLDYIGNLDRFEGIEGLPAFYAAYHYMGDAGVGILMVSLMALVLTSLIGMLRVVSHLCFSVAQDGILPKRYAQLSDREIPVNAVLLATLVSLPIPFLGRTTIGWIVDTTVIGATIIYGFSAMAVFKESGQELAAGNKSVMINRVLGGICVPILFIYLVLQLLPGIFSDHTIETETYVLMVAWSIIGVVFFNAVIRKDHARNFGKAVIVWIALLAFIVLMSMTLAERMNEVREDSVINEISSYIDDVASQGSAPDKEEFLSEKRMQLRFADNMRFIVIIGLFGLSLVVMLINYNSMQRWEKKALEERDKANTVAFRDALTGVKSKHAFAEREGELEAQVTAGELGEFGVIVCDLNGLKQINDTLGHKAGDEYIRTACRMLCQYFKHSPVYRVGGDEFVVLLQGHDFEVRQEIMDSINEEIEGNIDKGKVVMSLGLAEYDASKDASFHEVFQRADGLMYERKVQLKGMGAATRD
ncbi:MAG: amino acid permease, partial [Atopobiaceae bacterium]|nr:amino acid permease [Atopobiaceae bacterium]